MSQPGESSPSKAAINDVFWYAVSKLVPGTAGMLTIGILTRELAASNYGTYSVAITTIIICGQIFGVFISNPLLYLFNKYLVADRLPDLYLTAFRLCACSLLLGFAAAAIVLTLIGHTVALSLTAGVVVILTLLQWFAISILQANRRVTDQTKILVIQTSIQVLSLALVAYHDELNLVSALICQASGLLFSVLVAHQFIRSLVPRANSGVGNFDLETAQRFFALGWPLAIWFLSSQLLVFGDRFVLESFGYSRDLGSYAGAKDLLIGLTSIISMPLLLSSGPILMKAWAERMTTREIELLQGRYIVALTACFSLVFISTDQFGAMAFKLLLGENFEVDRSLVYLVLASIYVTALTMHLQRGFELAGKIKTMATIAVINSLFAAVLGLLFIPRVGVLAAATITLGAALGAALMTVVLVKKIALPRRFLMPAIYLSLSAIIYVLTVRQLKSAGFLDEPIINVIFQLFFYVAYCLYVFLCFVLRPLRVS